MLATSRLAAKVVAAGVRSVPKSGVKVFQNKEKGETLCNGLII
jgi:hypothetical protein